MIPRPVPDLAKPVLLVVDDDHMIRTLLAESLGMHGYQVETATNAKEMDGVLARWAVSLILLDVMMPGEDGLSVCRRLAGKAAPPVVMLSALGDEPDRVLGLEIGASHYLSKPCSPREILATVRAALRARAMQDAGDSREFGFLGWRVDFAAHELFDPDGTLIDLTDGEFAVLRAFVERPRRVLARDALLEAAPGPDTDAFDRAIDVQVSRLRRKLRSHDDEIIRTIRNEGYFFVPRVVRL
ncbi:two-component system OmpR family response regulator [Sphingomonas sp. PP-CE-1A-559]|uniref:response regulator n=1 Tax=Sphingomonas sp. PP-CE-1A-559 TaxID=2135657 RepID=UPI0010F0E592|nr:response regulator [Sphingomonas sp. PP-CE-1A-559]TCP92454.1 two-component system OmpR family response regulator [Sphingomonas sp. PP-CE-1A-559]